MLVHTPTSRAENSAQGSSCQLKLAHTFFPQKLKFEILPHFKIGLYLLVVLTDL
jgi:hypothetical protein